MTISWNGDSENIPTPPILEQLQLPLDDFVSNTYSPGTVYVLDNERYALTLDQNETTVTYLVIPRGQSVTTTHEEFNELTRS